MIESSAEVFPDLLVLVFKNDKNILKNSSQLLFQRPIFSRPTVQTEDRLFALISELRQKTENITSEGLH